MGHTYTHLLIHLIFGTKGRIPYLRPSVRTNVLAYMAGIARQIGGREVLINGMPDHVHIYLQLPPVINVADAVKAIKAHSSKWAHEERILPRSFAWQTGYAAFSVSPSNAGKTIRYIQDQESHHRKISFQDEYIAFLKKHGIAYDERFVWD